MKKLEKYKIAPQAKFVKFKVKDFVEIPTIRHKAVPPMLDCLKSSSPLNVSPPWLLKFSSCPPCLADDTKIIPSLSQGGGHYGCFSRQNPLSMAKVICPESLVWNGLPADV